VLGTDLLPVPWAAADDVDRAVEAAHEAFLTWRVTPAPVRGALVKRLGQLLTENLDDLADLVSLEVGKIRSEARGEVQEMVDICDFAVGLSRQLYGRTMPSERPGHRLMETWHPLGVVAVISAFNFPVAVWSWNTAVALVCGDTVVWKPSELTPLTALACSALLDRAAADVGAPEGLGQLVLGDASVAERIVDNPLVPLVSATGSVRMGAAVGPRVAARFGQSLLELGGNNATVVAPSADLDLAVRGIVFAAAGTAGQRCTSLRRMIVHESIADPLLDKVVAAYRRLPVGNPFEVGTLVGPLVNGRAFTALQAALDDVRGDGGSVLVGGDRQLADAAPDAF
jgi:aldehyde dehydrogenase (NAD+)